MSALTATPPNWWDEPLLKKPGSFMSRKSMTYFLLSTASITVQIHPYFLRTVDDFVVRYRTGFFVSGGRTLWSKSNTPTVKKRGGNFRDFTYPYSVYWLNPESKFMELNSVGTMTPI